MGAMSGEPIQVVVRNRGCLSGCGTAAILVVVLGWVLGVSDAIDAWASRNEVPLLFVFFGLCVPIGTYAAVRLAQRRSPPRRAADPGRRSDERARQRDSESE